LLGETNELDKTRGILGLHYLLPLNVKSRVWVETDGGMRFIFDKEFELIPRLQLFVEAEYDTVSKHLGVVNLRSPPDLFTHETLWFAIWRVNT